MIPENSVTIPDAAPNTGELLISYFKEKRTRKNALARMLKKSPSTLDGFTKKKSIQTTVLWEISHALKHNFFADIAASFPENYTNNVKPDPTKDDRIKQLELENIILKAEVAILVKTIKG